MRVIEAVAVVLALCVAARLVRSHRTEARRAVAELATMGALFHQPELPRA